MSAGGLSTDESTQEFECGGQAGSLAPAPLGAALSGVKITSRMVEPQAVKPFWLPSPRMSFRSELQA